MQKTASGIRCTVMKSGDRSRYAQVCVSSVYQLLDEATAKLHLPIAARRAFLANGREIKSVLEIPRNGEVFVSAQAGSYNSSNGSARKDKQKGFINLFKKF